MFIFHYIISAHLRLAFYIHWGNILINAAGCLPHREVKAHHLEGILGRRSLVPVRPGRSAVKKTYIINKKQSNKHLQWLEEWEDVVSL